jgi:hypothetical protein
MSWVATNPVSDPAVSQNDQTKPSDSGPTTY